MKDYCLALKNSSSSMLGEYFFYTYFLLEEGVDHQNLSNSLNLSKRFNLQIHCKSSQFSTFFLISIILTTFMSTLTSESVTRSDSQRPIEWFLLRTKSGSICYFWHWKVFVGKMTRRNWWQFLGEIFELEIVGFASSPYFHLLIHHHLHIFHRLHQIQALNWAKKG